MRVHKIELSYKPYQTVKIPAGAAPLTVEDDGPNKLALFFIGPDSLVGEFLQDFGLYVIPTGVTIPDDVVLFPVQHPLVNKVTQPNARYISTVNQHHICLGNPREEFEVVEAHKSL
jgi:hypothetical protein